MCEYELVTKTLQAAITSIGCMCFKIFFLLSPGSKNNLGCGLSTESSLPSLVLHYLLTYYVVKRDVERF